MPNFIEGLMIWVEEEFEAVDLADARVNNRALLLTWISARLP